MWNILGERLELNPISRKKYKILNPVHPLFEYDLNGKNYDQNMTILCPKLRLKYDWYVKIETINMTLRIHEKN